MTVCARVNGECIEYPGVSKVVENKEQEKVEITSNEYDVEIAFGSLDRPIILTGE